MYKFLELIIDTVCINILQWLARTGVSKQFIVYCHSGAVFEACRLQIEINYGHTTRQNYYVTCTPTLYIYVFLVLGVNTMHTFGHGT